MISNLLPVAASGALQAALSWDALWEDHGLPLAIMGLLVVFSALLLVCGFISLLPRIMAALDRFFPETSGTPPIAQPQVSAAEEISPEVLAVIAAVVADTVRAPHRIVHTRELTSEDLSWTLEGRRQHHASHSPQRRGHR